MDTRKQKLLIEYLISSTDTFALCQPIVLPEYFDPELRNTVSFIKQYFDQYHTTPTPEQVEAETDQALEYKNVTTAEISYTANEVEKFCRRKALERAVLNAKKRIDEEDFATLEQEVRDAILVSLNRDLGLRYFEDVEARLERMATENKTISTGWDEVDDVLFGGLSRKELAMLSANSGGGKSITLANLAYNFINRGYNALYISLELDQDVIAQRFDTMFTGVSRKDWKSHISQISTRLQQINSDVGTLDIVHLPAGSCANDFRAYLKEYYLHYNMMPDLLVVDYLDEMSPNRRVRADDVWTKDKLSTSELRQLVVDYNLVGATASQLNREAVKAAQHDHSHIAGGISKINVVDVYWSVLLTDSMKAAGDAAFHFQKTRNSDGSGNTVWLEWDQQHLLLQNRKTEKGINFKSKKEVEKETKNLDTFFEDTTNSEDYDGDLDEQDQQSGLLSLLERYNN